MEIHITIDFVIGLPKSPRGNDAIWVVVDRLTKSRHFLPKNVKKLINKLVEQYVKEVVRFYGEPVRIVSNRDLRFTSKFWGSIQTYLGTQLKFNIAYHP